MTYERKLKKMCVLKLDMMTIYSQGTIRRGTDRCRLLGEAEKPDAKKIDGMDGCSAIIGNYGVGA